MGVEVLADDGGAAVVEVAEEDEADVVVQAELEVGVLLFQALELDDEFLDEEG